MPTNRPHLSKLVTQLQELFEARKEDPKLLRELLSELKHRTTPSALVLRKKVDAALASHGMDRPTESTSRDEAEPPPPPPTHQTILCRSCQTSISVPIRTGRTASTCPTCNTEFETLFHAGVLQVIWTEPAPKKPDSAKMTETGARDLLGVGKDDDFATIKAAWRRASQQYHPDKHQKLPQRLRSAAELEMKRINEAYRLLERLTVSDF